MKFCLIGERLSHSYSVDIHSTCGLDYKLQEVSKDRLKDFVVNNDYDGYNITIPYKKDIIPFLDELDQSAKIVGTVNTVKKIGNKSVGYNTDYFGIEYMLNKAKISVKNKKVLILGNGGASRAVVAYCKENCAQSVVVVSRTGEVNYHNFYNYNHAEIIVNATPVGMYPNNQACLVDLDKFSNLTAVVDLIYNPFITKLLFKAKNKNINFVNGLNMLVAQALKAQEIWLDKPLSFASIEQIYNQIVLNRQNIVLIGMPSCGKSSVGKILAQELNKNFVDLDQQIYIKIKKTPSQIITEQGEQEFRKIESQIIEEFGKHNGQVIATGGGAILSEINRFNLLQNGKIVYIKRDLDKLSVKDRPLSQTIGLESLYNKRKEIYLSFADIVVENNGDILNCVKAIKERL